MAPKKKAEKMSLNSFLGAEEYGGSWADDLPDLPTAPAPKDDSMMMGGMGGRGGDFLSSRPDRGPLAPREEVPLPTVPPFSAFVGNLSFDASEDTIRGHFGSEHEITRITIKTDDEGKAKGFGYVDFATLDGLKSALDKHGSLLSNRQIRVNVAEQRKPRDGYRNAEDDKFASPWRREGGPPARDDFAAPRRRFDNMGGPGAEPREPSASENNSDWRSNRPPPRIPSESDMPPRRRGSNFTPPHEGEPGAADSEDKWVIGGRFKASQGGDNQPGGRFGSIRGRTEGGPQAANAPPSPAEEGPWRRAKPVGSSSPTGSVPPTPQMGRRKLDLLPRSTSGSAQPSPLSSPKEKGFGGSKSSPFGAAKPVDVRAREDAAAQKIEEVKERIQQQQPMSRTNSRQPRERPPHPSRTDSGHRSIEGNDAAPLSPASGAESPGPTSAHAPTPATVRPSFSFASAASGKKDEEKQEIHESEGRAENEDVESVTEKLAEVIV